MKKLFYLLIIPFLLSSCWQKTDLELLNDFCNKLTELDSYEYAVGHKMYRSYTDKSTIRKGTAYFEKNQNDSVVGYNYYFDVTRKPYYFVSYYSGDKEIIMRLNDSTAYFRDIKKLPINKRINQPFFYESILSINQWISNDSIIKALTVKDTVVQRVQCKLFLFNISEINYNWWNDKNKGNNSYDIKIAFDSKSGIPVYLYSKEHIIDDFNKPTVDYILNQVYFSDFRKVKYPKKQLTVKNVPEYFHWGIKKQKLEKSMLAPDFKLPNTKNEMIDFKAFRGKYVLLEFGFIGCGPCKASIPTMNQISEKYSEDKLKVIGINLYCDNLDKVSQYKLKNQINYEYLKGNDDIAKKYKVQSAPTIYLIDKNGQIIYSSNGMNDKELDFILQKTFGV